MYPEFSITSINLPFVLRDKCLQRKKDGRKKRESKLLSMKMKKGIFSMMNKNVITMKHLFLNMATKNEIKKMKGVEENFEDPFTKRSSLMRTNNVLVVWIEE